MSDQFVVGDIKTIVIPGPAAGADFSYTVPSGQRLHVKNIAFNLATDANVASRTPIIRVEDPEGGNSFFASSEAIQTANKNWDYSFAHGNRNMSGSTGGYVTSELAAGIVLVPGDILHSDILNIQVGDQLSEVYINVESFLLP